MSNLTGYHEKAVELATELVEHGWGELTIKATTLKDDPYKVKVEVLCGKSFVFFVKKNIRLRDRTDII